MEELRNDAQLGGRIPLKYKEFVDSLWKDEEGHSLPGENFATAIKKLIDAYSSKPVEKDENTLDFNNDINSIKTAMSSIEKVIEGIQSKVSIHTDTVVNNCNKKIKSKDDVLLETESTLRNLDENFKEAYDSFMIEQSELQEKYDSVSQQLENALSIIDEQNIKIKDNEKTIKGLINEKDSLILEKKALLTENESMKDKVSQFEETSEKIKILEEEKVKLELKLSGKTERLREKKEEFNRLVEDKSSLETYLLNIQGDLNDAKNESTALKSEKFNLENRLKDVESVLEENKIKNNKLENKLSELSDNIILKDKEIASLELQYQKDLYAEKESIRENIKNDLERKYESKIDSLKDEIKDLKNKIKDK